MGCMNRLVLPLVSVTLTCSVQAQTPNPSAFDDFERSVRPLLIAKCVGCHGPKKQEAGLRLDSRNSTFAKLEFGTAVIPGDVKASRLSQVIQYIEDDVQMPPKGKLSATDIRVLIAWIQSGAAWPREADPAAANVDARKNHWAFQPISRPPIPSVKNSAWPRTSVDRFVLARLEAEGLKPAASAAPRTLVRRASFDLIGLPPVIGAVRRLEQDSSDSAWLALIDELLESKHFGERWARYWMDVARYSDTTGYVFTQDRKLGDAWKYRDWLINAFNDDMSIKDFLIHQIAVDQVLPKDAGDKLAATGFLTLGRRFLNNKHDIIDDRIDVVTRGMMGFTVTCARCHDHKYDPIPSADYYSLYGVFASTHEPDRAKSTVRLADLPKPFDPYVFVRGQQHNHGDRVPRQFLSALSPNRQPFKQGSGRRELADAIANDNNPLTARVFVNRVWGHLFGRYLVDTPSDFGVRSEPPTHPELLDHLASSFIEQGWSLKWLVREIMRSSVYRQSSFAEPSAVDPENRLLSRMNRRRLDFEAHRDAFLAVSGELDRTIGGPSVEITKAPFPKRRTVYAHIDRQNLPGLFRAFDLANPDTHAPQRFQTTVPQQGLFLLNNPFVLERAAELAKRTHSIADTSERIRELFRLTYSREPTEAELTGSLEFGFGPKAGDSNEPLATGGWAYGFGAFDSQTNRVASFTAFPAFASNSWRGGDSLPDPRIGWSHLHRNGGHPGDARHAAIRRWVSPRNGTLSVRGLLKHPSKEGDGVIGRLVSNRTGQIREWKVAHRGMPTVSPRIEVTQGEIIDFVCESGVSVNHDSFEWKVVLRLTSPQGRPQSFQSERDFTGRPIKALDTWAQFAQVLLLANEFVFVD